MKNQSPIQKNLLFIAVLLVLNCVFIPVRGQFTLPASDKQPARPATGVKMTPERMVIDSLKMVIDYLHNESRIKDSIILAEQLVSTGLRNHINELDSNRKKLEEANTDVMDDNLKLNQSNRILIIFNSLVAVLLVVSLVFFLRRISARRKEEQLPVPVNNNTSSQPTANNNAPARPPVLAGFEDKLLHLERLGKLREKGLLTEEEFVSEKHQILGK